MSANTDLEPNAISNLIAWRQVQQAEINRREQELIENLRKNVPDNLQQWLAAEATFMRNLIQDGHSTHTYRRFGCDGSAFGYINLREFEQQLRLLENAWKDIVGIDICWDDDGECFEASFTAI